MLLGAEQVVYRFGFLVSFSRIFRLLQMKLDQNIKVVELKNLLDSE